MRTNLTLEPGDFFRLSFEGEPQAPAIYLYGTYHDASPFVGFMPIDNPTLLAHRRMTITEVAHTYAADPVVEVRR